MCGAGDSSPRRSAALWRVALLLAVAAAVATTPADAHGGSPPPPPPPVLGGTCGSQVVQHVGVSVSGAPGCRIPDYLTLQARLTSALGALQGAQGNATVWLADCTAAVGRRAGAQAEYRFGATLAACAGGSRASTTMGASVLACADLPGLCDALPADLAPARVRGVARRSGVPVPIAVPQLKGARITARVTWQQMLGAAPVAVTADLQPVATLAVMRRAAWLVAGAAVTGPAARHISLGDASGLQLVITPVPLHITSLAFVLELTYGTGTTLQLPGSLWVSTAGITLPKQPVQVVPQGFVLNQLTQTAVVDVRKSVVGGASLNVQTTSFSQPIFGTLVRQGDALLYRLDPSKAPAGRSRLWDQFDFTVRVLPGKVTALDTALQPHLDDPSLYFAGKAVVAGALQGRLGGPPVVTSNGSDCFEGVPDDTCVLRPDQQPVLPVQAYSTFSFADFNGGKLTIMAAESITLTSDTATPAAEAYLVPPCYDLEVYADTIIIDRELNITGPRSAKLWAREVRCNGPHPCVISTRGYPGLDFGRGGQERRQAPAGADGELKGLTEDGKGSGKESSDGSKGRDGCNARAGGDGGSVLLFAANAGLAPGAGPGEVQASVRFIVNGGPGGVGQIGANGGKGGDVQHPSEDQCRRHWCHLQEAPVPLSQREIAARYSDTTWYSGITEENFWGMGCHAGNAGRGGDAGANGENAAGGNAGRVTLAMPVPAALVDSLTASAGGPDWRTRLAESLAGTKPHNGGQGGRQPVFGKGGQGGATNNNCWATEGLWAKVINHRGQYSFRCGFIREIDPKDQRFWMYSGVNDPADCKVNRHGADGVVRVPGADGAPSELNTAALDRAPPCDQGAECRLLSETTAAAFKRAASMDQLNMMLNKGTLAFQSRNYGLAASLTQWVYETAPCFPDAPGSPACGMRKQAQDIWSYVAYGMDSRGSIPVLTPRSSLQLLQKYVCKQLLPRMKDLQALYDLYYKTSASNKEREEAMSQALAQYQQYVVDAGAQNAQLEKDIASTDATVKSLARERAAIFGKLQEVEYMFTAEIEKMEESKRHWSFGGLLSVMSSALMMVPGLAGTIGLIQGAFRGGVLDRSFAITSLIAAGPGTGGIFDVFDKTVKPDKGVTTPTDFSKVVVGSEDWMLLVEPYLKLPVGSNYSALLSSYTVVCDAHNKALIQLEGFRVQLDQTYTETQAAKVKLENAKEELAKAKSKNFNAPNLLGALNDAYTTVQKRVLDALYQQALALAYIKLEPPVYTPPQVLNYEGMQQANARLGDQIYDYLSKGTLEQQTIMEVTVTDEQVSGLSIALRIGSIFSVTLSAMMVPDASAKTHVVAERVEAYVLGARAVITGAKSNVRMVHTGHAEFLNKSGHAFTYRHQALDAILAETRYDNPDNPFEGVAVATTGMLRSPNNGAYGGLCQELTIPDNNNLLLPVSPFTVWMVDVPPGANTGMDFEDAYGLFLRFHIRYITQNQAVARSTAQPLRNLHPAWSKAVRFGSGA